MIRKTITFIAQEAEQRHIVLTVSFAPSPLECEVDIVMMRQVLLNLLKNAMEAMTSGGKLTVNCGFSAADQDHSDSALIEIVDTGKGIPESEVRKVFRPLYSTKAHGMGLGLSFCRQAVEEHGGTISLASRPGNGTTVTLLLPIKQCAGRFYESAAS